MCGGSSSLMVIILPLVLYDTTSYHSHSTAFGYGLFGLLRHFYSKGVEGFIRTGQVVVHKGTLLPRYLGWKGLKVANNV